MNEVALATTILDENAQALAILLQDNIELNKPFNNIYCLAGITPLVLAVATGNPIIVSTLIEAKANVNLPTGEIWKNYFYMFSKTKITASIKLPASIINFITYFCNHSIGSSCLKIYPLHIAAKYGFTEITELLIKAGAEIDIKTENDNKTPLYIALSHNHLKTASLLLENGAKLNTFVSKKTLCCVKIIPGGEFNEPPAKEGHYNSIPFLYNLIAKNKDKSAIFLIEHGINFNKPAKFHCKGEIFPYDLALRLRKYDVIKALIKISLRQNQRIESKSGFMDTEQKILASFLQARTKILLKFFFKIGLAIKANLTLLSAQSALITDDITENMVIIGLKINGQLVTNSTPGFQYAITNYKDLAAHLNQLKLANTLNIDYLNWLIFRCRIYLNHHSDKEFINLHNLLLRYHPQSSLKELTLHAIKYENPFLVNKISWNYWARKLTFNYHPNAILPSELEREIVNHNSNHYLLAQTKFNFLKLLKS